MCFSYLKKNRNWALWLSGFFSMGALSALFLAIVNQPINVLGITVDRNLYLLRFVLSGAIAYLLLHYWGKAQEKRKRR